MIFEVFKKFVIMLKEDIYNNSFFFTRKILNFNKILYIYNNSAVALIYVFMR